MKKTHSISNRERRIKFFFCAIVVAAMTLGTLFAFGACGGRQTLVTPANLEFDGPTNILSWTEVPYSTGGYQIRLVGEGATRYIDLDEYSNEIYRCKHCGYILNEAEYGLTGDDYELPLACRQCLDNCVHSLDDMYELYNCQICNPTETVFVRTERRGTPNWTILTGLRSGLYSAFVRALTIDTNFFRDSSWSSPLEFYIARESGMQYRRINNGTEYEVASIGTASGDIVIASYHNGLPVTSIGDNAFFIGANRLTRVVVGSNVTRIGNSAFSGARWLEEIILPDGLVSIGDRAFRDNLLLTSISIPNSVNHIGENAFSATGLRDISLPFSLTSISNQLFSNALLLTEVNIGSNVQSIGQHAFSGTISLRSINLPSSLRSIDRLAFMNSGLQSIVIPEGMRRIGPEAFASARELNSITIPNSVTSIGVGAFRNTLIWDDESDTMYGLIYADGWVIGGHDNLISFATIADGTRGIAELAFRGFRNLEDVYLPDTLMHINAGAFGDRRNDTGSAFNTRLWNDQASNRNDGVIYAGDWLIMSLDHERTYVVIEPGVVGIANDAFRGRVTDVAENRGHRYLTNIICGLTGQGMGAGGAFIPHGIRSIGDYAFANNISLPSLTLPGTLRHIGDFAFYGCGLRTVETVPITHEIIITYTGIVDFVIPDSVEHIGRFAFGRMHNLREMTIPSGVTEISDGLFFASRNIHTVHIHDGLTRIGEQAFVSTPSLRNIGVPINGITEGAVIPDSVTSFGSRAFFNAGITAITLPRYITCIADEMFRYADSLTQISIPEGVTRLGYAAFMSTGFETLTLPSTLTTIEDRAFMQSIFLRSLVIPEGVTSIGARVFQNSWRLEDIVLPNSLRTIGDFAFANTQNIASIVIPEGVTHLGRYSFFGINLLEYISLPSTLRGIDEYAFARNPRLTSVTLGASVVGVGAHAFHGCNSITIYTNRSWRGEHWSMHWNSSQRPVVWDSIISEQGNYVVGVRIMNRVNPDGTITRRITNPNPVVSGQYRLQDVFNPDTGENEQQTVWVYDGVPGLSAPIRQGYTFVGWAISEGGREVLYNVDTKINAPDGTILYAIWDELP